MPVSATKKSIKGVLDFRRTSVSDMTRALEGIARTLERNMLNYVSLYSTEEGRFVGSARDLARLVNARNEIDRLLVNSGYSRVTQGFVARELPQMQSLVEDAWAQMGLSANLTALSENAFRSLTGITVDGFADIGAIASNALRRGLVEAVTGNTNWQNWANDFRDMLFSQDREGLGMFSRAATLARTAVDQVNRLTAKNLGDDAGIEFYEYFGGLIESSREFCVEHDGSIYHVDEIAEMDNEQTADVFISCGGYNCRHEWLPVLREDVPEDVMARVEEAGIELLDQEIAA